MSHCKSGLFLICKLLIRHKMMALARVRAHMPRTSPSLQATHHTTVNKNMAYTESTTHTHTHTYVALCLQCARNTGSTNSNTCAGESANKTKRFCVHTWNKLVRILFSSASRLQLPCGVCPHRALYLRAGKGCGFQPVVRFKLRPLRMFTTTVTPSLLGCTVIIRVRDGTCRLIQTVVT